MAPKEEIEGKIDRKKKNPKPPHKTQHGDGKTQTQF